MDLIEIGMRDLEEISPLVSEQEVRSDLSDVEFMVPEHLMPMPAKVETRGLKKGSVKAMLPRIELGCRLYLCGMKLTDAAKYSKCSANGIMFALGTQEGIELKQKVRSELDDSFKNLQRKAIDVIDKALDSPSPAIALDGANLFLRTMKETKVKVELTAEDIVARLLRGENMNQELGAQ